MVNEIIEFNWVLKVLESSTKYPHIEASSKLLELFLNKYDISSIEKTSLVNRFNKIKEIKCKELVAYF